MEAVAETDEELLDKYLEDGELSEDEIRKGLAAGMKSGDVVPVFGPPQRRPASRASSTRRTTTPTPAEAKVEVAGGGEISADANGPLGGPGLQDNRRPLRRQAHLPACLLRHAQGRLARLEREPQRGRAHRPALRRPRQDAGADAAAGRRRYRRRRQARRNADRRHAYDP